MSGKKKNSGEVGERNFPEKEHALISRKQAKSIFNSIAQIYEIVNHLMSGGLDIIWRDRMVEYFDGFCLDLAGGTGEISRRISCSHKVLQVVCADISEGMLKFARTKEYCIAPYFVIADAHELPFRSEYFDTVGVAFGVRNFQERSKAVDEIRRILKVGGKLVVLDTFRPDDVPPPFKTFYLVWLNYIIPRLAGFLTGDRDSYFYMARSIMNFWSPDEFCSFLEGKGFEVLEKKGLSFNTVHIIVAKKVS